MMVLIHATGQYPDIQFLAPEWDGVQVYAVGELQDFSSRLFRDPDIVGILHCHLPDMAAQVVRGMRHGNIKSRLIVLLRESPVDQIRVKARHDTLIAGSDDVQPDTIDPRELVARLRALAARGEYIDHARIDVPGAVFRATSSGFETDDGRYVHMSAKLCQVMIELGRRPRQTRSKQQIMDALYGGVDEPELKIVDVLVCKLRRKIEEATGGLDVIETVWGRGYQFIPEGFRPERGATFARLPR